MAGVAESCTHVGALLFMVDACVRLKEKATVTDEPAYWKLPSSINKVQPEILFCPSGAYSLLFMELASTGVTYRRCNSTVRP
ncbi:unnamed protein product [Merluccius merluccius]